MYDRCDHRDQTKPFQLRKEKKSVMGAIYMQILASNMNNLQNIGFRPTLHGVRWIPLVEADFSV